MQKVEPITQASLNLGQGTGNRELGAGNWNWEQKTGDWADLQLLYVEPQVADQGLQVDLRRG